MESRLSLAPFGSLAPVAVSQHAHLPPGQDTDTQRLPPSSVLSGDAAPRNPNQPTAHEITSYTAQRLRNETWYLKFQSTHLVSRCNRPNLLLMRQTRTRRRRNGLTMQIGTVDTKFRLFTVWRDPPIKHCPCLTICSHHAERSTPVQISCRLE